MKFFNLESKTNNKEKLKESKISLHFFRHGKPGAALEGQHDGDRHLTDLGMEQAQAKSTNDANLDQSIAFGSPRVRSQETAAYVMTGDQINETAPDEIIDALDKELKVGSKVGITEKLNFNEGSPKFEEAMGTAYNEGKYIDFVIKESDNLAESLGDKEASSLSVQAGNIAEIIMKYATTSNRWNNLVNDPTKKYDGELERFLGSHQGVLESFLYKVAMEKYAQGKPIEHTNDFAAELSAAGGFGFVEGFDISVVQKNQTDQPEIVMNYSRELADKKQYKINEKLTLPELQNIILEKEIHYKKAEIGELLNGMEKEFADQGINPAWSEIDQKTFEYRTSLEEKPAYYDPKDKRVAKAVSTDQKIQLEDYISIAYKEGFKRISNRNYYEFNDLYIKPAAERMQQIEDIYQEIKKNKEVIKNSDKKEEKSFYEKMKDTYNKLVK